MKEKYLHIGSRWRRLLFTLLLSCIIFYGNHRPRRARVHWLGHDRRPRRLERALGLFVFGGGLIFLEPREYMLWSAWWGGMASVFVIWCSLYKLLPRRQYHWVSK